MWAWFSTIDETKAVRKFEHNWKLILLQIKAANDIIFSLL